MDTIIEQLRVLQITPRSYAEKLKALGMRESDYPMISDKAIEEFLVSRIPAAHPTHHGTPTFYPNETNEKRGCREYRVNTPIVHLTKRRLLPTKHDKDWTGYVRWWETPLHKYQGNPPERVLNSAIRAMEKNYTDLCVVTVSFDSVRDPLLIAFKGGMRYLVDWWDVDVTIEELTALVEGTKDRVSG